MNTFPSPFYRWRPHPWHGLEPGPQPPRLIHAYIEITPFDLVKYEIDKTTGYLRVDRPQRSSSQPPTLYGFIPRTYCGRPITRSEMILNAKVVGGLQLADVPKVLIERLSHYFSTYKLVPGQESGVVIREVYELDHALRVVEAALQDYQEAYGSD